MAISTVTDVVGVYHVNWKGGLQAVEWMVVGDTAQPNEGTVDLVMPNGYQTRAEAVFAFENGGAQFSLAQQMQPFPYLPATNFELTAKFTESLHTDGSEPDMQIDGTLDEVNAIVSTDKSRLAFSGTYAWRHLTPKNLADFKALYPDDPSVQNVTLVDLMNHAINSDPDGSTAKRDPVHAHTPIPRRLNVATCIVNLAMVAIDCVLLVANCTALARVLGASSGALSRVATILERLGTAKFEKVVNMLEAATDKISKAKAVWEMIKTLSALRVMEKVVGAITKSLHWWDWLVFGVMIIGTLLAAFGTGGLALAGMIVLAMTGLITLGQHIYACTQTCGSSA